MKTLMNLAMVGMLLSSSACLSQDAGDLTIDDPAEEPSTSAAESSLRPHPGPDFYITCSDDPNVCSAGYGSVSIVPDASCQPFASHLVTCRYGSVSL